MSKHLGHIEYNDEIKRKLMTNSNNSIYYITALVERERSNRNWVKWWLYVICFMVFAMVIVGGATRLTDSGLSITEWKPIHGMIPPLNVAEWLEEFEKYKLIPEYSQINEGMSLAQFKFIYWWEWAHRFLGRIIGLVFALPLAFFWLTGRLESKLKPRLLFLLVLGGLQGAIGWWMVSSGLVDRVDVSQYRLAIHLTLACFIFAYALWIARGITEHSTKQVTNVTLRILAPLIAILALVQIFLGGLVAGLDAGLTYNTWPLMDGVFIPDGRDVLSPLWLNWFENPKSVQFNHRIGAYILTFLVTLQFVFTWLSNGEKPHFNRSVILLVLVIAQAIAGIVTLVMQVPLHWALVHQALAVIFLAATIAHWRGLSGPYVKITDLQKRG